MEISVESLLTQKEGYDPEAEAIGRRFGLIVSHHMYALAVSLPKEVRTDFRLAGWSPDDDTEIQPPSKSSAVNPGSGDTFGSDDLTEGAMGSAMHAQARSFHNLASHYHRIGEVQFGTIERATNIADEALRSRHESWKTMDPFLAREREKGLDLLKVQARVARSQIRMDGLSEMVDTVFERLDKHMPDIKEMGLGFLMKHNMEKDLATLLEFVAGEVKEGRLSVSEEVLRVMQKYAD